MTQPSCTVCGQSFTVTQGDLTFYDHMSPVFNGVKYAIPPPTRCPQCRLQRRLVFRNHTAIFQRPASPDGQTIFSMHPASAPFPVMRNEDWMKDDWDPCDYGRDYDFHRPFFEQFAELRTVVPQYARVTLRCENCDYCNNLSDNKNCYMVFSMSLSEGCMFCEDTYECKDCLECTKVYNSERCYDCVDCLRCFNLQSSEACENCSESHFLTYCRSCSNCFGCSNLRHQQYCIFNEQKTKAEYEAFLRQFQGTSYQEREAMRSRFQQEALRYSRPHASFHLSENCTGNYLVESRNVVESCLIRQGENLKYCFNLTEHVNDCMDFSLTGRHAELIYESCTCVINVSRLRFCMQCRDGCSDLFYCYGCDACQNCFGCTGMRRKQYCILNKQYTKKEYETLVPKIIDHMRNDGGGGLAMNRSFSTSLTAGSATGSWGEFFPESLSPMPYNRSFAQRYFPLTRSEAQERGFLWEDDDSKEFSNAIDASLLPDGLPEDHTPLVVKSLQSGKPFRITTQEIAKCQELSAPLPRLTYQERMDERAVKLGGTRLFERTCARTGKRILTTYPPEYPYILWEREEYVREFQ
ncbi:MAG: hypothetical protein WCG83_01960 [Candidatus Peregrinibacteria bacterium]